MEFIDTGTLDATMESMNKKLLAISWAMPPILCPRSIQVSRLLVGLARRGWHSTVLFTSRTYVLPSLYKLDDSIEKATSGYYDCIEITPLRDVSLEDISHETLLHMWTEAAINAAQNIMTTEHYDALVTFAQPWVDHLIGLELRKTFNIPWIAHFSDPWVDNIYSRDVDTQKIKLWKNQERQVIEKADGIIFTNRYAQDLAMKKYPFAWRKKTWILPHCFDPSVISTHKKKSRPKHQQLRIVCTGNLYSQRSPDSLLKAIKMLSEEINLSEILKFDFFGGSHLYYKEKVREIELEDVVEFHPTVPYFDSLKLLGEADVLLVIDAPSKKASPFLPSKLVDYLMYSRPILGLSPLKGTSADLLRQLGCYIIAPDNVPGIIKVVKEIIIAWKKDTLTVSTPFKEIAARYHVDKISEECERIIFQTVQKPIKKGNIFTRLLRTIFG